MTHPSLLPAPKPCRYLPGVLALVPLAAALLLPAGQAQASPFGCLPIYGNWCGPGVPRGPGLPPVDAYDAACMRHDLCTMSGPETPCDVAFVGELHQLAAQNGYLPRPLQWAEYVIRFKSGGGWGGMPMPTPWDAMGLMSSVASPCW
jgi:hypothetical protein